MITVDLVMKTHGTSSNNASPPTVQINFYLHIQVYIHSGMLYKSIIDWYINFVQWLNLLLYGYMLSHSCYCILHRNPYLLTLLMLVYII